MMRLGDLATLALPLLGGVARAAPEVRLTPSPVVLRSGSILQGRVTGVARIDGKEFTRVESDYGNILVPSKDVLERGADHPVAGPFHAREVRVVRLQGTVQRRGHGEDTWTNLTEASRYADAQPVEIRPGDSLRTGGASLLECLLHRAVWLRLEPDSEITLGKWGSPHSLSLLRGTMHGDLERGTLKRPFVVQLPSAVLGVKGTRFAVESSGPVDSVFVSSGLIEVQGRGNVGAGEAASLGSSATDRIAIRPLTEVELRGLQQVPQGRPPDDMVYVPGGDYTIGYDVSRGSIPALSPYTGTTLLGATTIRLRAFLIDRLEVSENTYERYARGNAGAAPSAPPDDKDRMRPAYGMTYEEAAGYASWLGKLLPTASQWQVAAVGNTGTYFPWGDRVDPAHALLVVGTYQVDERGGRWIPPADLPSVEAPTIDVSPFGVRGMVSGVVPEWVRSPLSADPMWGVLLAQYRSHFETHGHRHAMQGYGNSVYAPVAVGDNEPGIRCVLELR